MVDIWLGRMDNKSVVVGGTEVTRRSGQDRPDLHSAAFCFLWRKIKLTVKVSHTTYFHVLSLTYHLSLLYDSFVR